MTSNKYFALYKSFHGLQFGMNMLSAQRKTSSENNRQLQHTTISFVSGHLCGHTLPGMQIHNVVMLEVHNLPQVLLLLKNVTMACYQNIKLKLDANSLVLLLTKVSITDWESSVFFCFFFQLVYLNDPFKRLSVLFAEN